jgi:hypothetical protein
MHPSFHSGPRSSEQRKPDSRGKQAREKDVAQRWVKREKELALTVMHSPSCSTVYPSVTRTAEDKTPDRRMQCRGQTHQRNSIEERKNDESHLVGLRGIE